MNLISNRNNTNINIIIILAASLLFIPFLGGVHLFDWDEINFAESAREMIATGDYLTIRINYQPFWEKPPLFIWMQVLSMKTFGINEFAARFPNAVCGIITLLLLFNIGRKLYNEKFGLVWAMTYVGSFLPFFYFKSGIIDPWFNLFIFLGIYLFYMFLEKKLNIFLVLSAILIGLGILTKGPVALLIFLLTVGIFWGLNRFRLQVSFLNLLVYFLVLIFTGGFWFILQILNGNFKIIVDFIEYQIRLFQTEDAGHGGFLLYHFVILLIGVFPASIFALKGFISHKNDTASQTRFQKWMIILFWVVLILFTIVKTKIVHYSSLCYFPLTYLAALVIYKLVEKKNPVPNWIRVLIAALGILFICITSAFPLLHVYKNKLIESDMIHDEFAKGNLQANVHWSGFEPLIGLVLLAGIAIFLVYSKNKNIMKGIIPLFCGSALFIFLIIIFLTPKIEKYSQYAAIEFFKQISAENAYVETLGYKSYAHLFYSDKKKPVNPKSYDKNWLLSGNIDKKAYFSLKITKKKNILEKYPDLKILYEKNGFVFCVRNPE